MHTDEVWQVQDTGTLYQGSEVGQVGRTGEEGGAVRQGIGLRPLLTAGGGPSLPLPPPPHAQAGVAHLSAYTSRSGKSPADP